MARMKEHERVIYVCLYTSLVVVCVMDFFGNKLLEPSGIDT